MINPNLDLEVLSEEFKVDNRLKIKEFLQPDVAERLRNACLNNASFSTHYVLDGQYQSKTPEEMAKLSPQQAHDINNKVSLAASQGIGFLYEGYMQSKMKDITHTESNSERVFLHDTIKNMSSDEILNPIKQITGDQNIRSADPQYTRYTSGHFLTRHLDVVQDKNRLYAFVLGMTKGWHPDWGGLLQFYEQDGAPRDAWAPEFNVLSIFEISHIHAVTYVTPYASQPRLSLTGWFIDKN